MILIVDEMHPALMEGLQEQQIHFNYQPSITRSEVTEIIAQYEGLIVRSKFFIDKKLIDCAPRLQFIARAGSGTDNIDSDYVSARGITIINAPEALCDAVAEHTIGLILGLKHNIVKSNAEVKNLKWERERNRGFELMGSTLGIIGYGHAGSAVARKIAGFGMKVIAYDKYKVGLNGTNDSVFFDAYATSCNLNAIYEQADILSLHVPLTNETTGWVDKKFFDQFKKPIVFINTSRGGIVNTADLCNSLETGQVKAAALDVLELEPPFDDTKESTSWFNRLRERNNVVITPHIAGWSVESFERISRVLLQKIVEFELNK